MESQIQEELKRIQNEHQVEILFACESGSRAWGFPSPDSDYDVRFVYKHPVNWYLSIDPKSDVIDLPIESELDLVGWDIKKALSLCGKSNPSLLEWVRSPIIYTQQDGFVDGFKTIAEQFFSPQSLMYHHLSIAKKHFDQCVGVSEVRLKAYFYALRSALSCEWIVKCNSIPPVQFNHLLALMEERQLILQLIEELLEIKADTSEAYNNPIEQELNDYLMNTIEWCDAQAKYLAPTEKDKTVLDDFFRKTVLD